MSKQYFSASKLLLMHKALLLLLLVCSASFGQTFKGKIEDGFGIPVSRANVLDMDTNTHTHTDANGVFELANTRIGNTLVITHDAYQSQSFVVEHMDQLAVIQLQRTSISLDEVIIGNKLNALRLIADVDIQKNPVNSSQEILQKVPGLFIGQHAGGGKAEQIFLRGFDIDHGTDINLTVDGLPVNMVSHAHGQGYADLHFVIPETLEQIDFGKGPYNQNKGNFATAGYVDFRTKRRLERSSINWYVYTAPKQSLCRSRRAPHANRFHRPVHTGIHCGDRSQLGCNRNCHEGSRLGNPFVKCGNHGTGLF